MAVVSGVDVVVKKRAFGNPSDSPKEGFNTQKAFGSGEPRLAFGAQGTDNDKVVVKIIMVGQQDKGLGNFIHIGLNQFEMSVAEPPQGKGVGDDF